MVGLKTMGVREFIQFMNEKELYPDEVQSLIDIVAGKIGVMDTLYSFETITYHVFNLCLVIMIVLWMITYVRNEDELEKSVRTEMLDELLQTMGSSLVLAMIILWSLRAYIYYYTTDIREWFITHQDILTGIK